MLGNQLSEQGSMGGAGQALIVARLGEGAGPGGHGQAARRIAYQAAQSSD